MLLNIVANYLIPIIYSSFISLIISLILIHLFRIKDSNIRILLLLLPLIRPFLIIIERINPNKYYFSFRTGVLGLRFPSPNIIIDSAELLKKSPILVSDFNYLLVVIIIISILIIIFIRIIGLYFFYRNLAFEEIITKKDAPDLFKNINHLSHKLKTKIPRVSLTTKKIYSPFIIGIIKTTLVISPSLLMKLSDEEIKIIVGHELAHLKRKDNIITWVTLVLRDLMFFNPFAYLAYYLIKLEQEKGSDRLVITSTTISKKKLANNILKILLKIKEISQQNTGRFFLIDNDFLGGYLTNISLKVRIRSLISLNSKRAYMNIYLKILMYALFLFFLLIQIMVVVKLGNTYIFLR